MTTPHRRPRIVAIDASEDVRNPWREVLCGEGYEVVVVGCGEASRDLLRELAPDAVLLDCFFDRDPSGWELLQVLSLDEVLQRVPVVICTTGDRVVGHDTRMSGEVGIQLLSKPFESAELLSAIATALRTAELELND